ncbi:MAG TPA: GH1 family beta-glucosidase [Solirubrobacteraceae bacterium]|nr:GH1 family beta-glucosidase [Solirubrobacteraceae bacterium]
MTTTGGAAAAQARAFPGGFLWGAATAAYQIEGAVAEDGRGPSVWDTFSHTPGKIANDETGDIACDFYHRWESDLDLLAAIGLNAFRFSVAWPRVQPTGRGEINQAGLDFYRALVNGLREREITPAITLYHWDLPQSLEDDGGWANRDTAQRFAEFARIVAEAIGDAGGLWLTLNEPQQVAHQGYRVGTHAPGLTDNALAAAATHHLLLAHGLALGVLRETLPTDAKLGIALDFHPVRAIDERAEEAAAILDAEQNRMFFDPVLHGHYPRAAREYLLPPPSLIEPGDMALICAPIDFLGINYYNPHYLEYSEAGGDEPGIGGRPGVVEFKPAALRQTSMGWVVEPTGLFDTLVAVNDEAPDGLALYITENGCAAADSVDADGEVEDFDRVAYLHGHLAEARRAIVRGVPLAGYFVWSLLDNFEWAWGYDKRFGLVFVDFDTQKRVPKRSAGFYRQVAITNSLPAETPPREARGVDGAGNGKAQPAADAVG